jgi:hypothetical protein
MSSLKYAVAGALDGPGSARESAARWAARALRSASVALARWSRRLAKPARSAVQPAPQLEFYAEAGAPEGALYLDGQFVGFLSGVKRL